MKFDALEAKADNTIVLLQARRTALITAAVTGKIDVRHGQPPAVARPSAAGKGHSCHFGQNRNFGRMATTVSSAPLAFAAIGDLPEITASDLKNKFSEIARLTAREPVAVTRHNRREFVILTAGQYEEFQQSRRAPLESLAGEFDQLVAKMNTPKARRATASLFAASPKALGKAAVTARRSTHA